MFARKKVRRPMGNQKLMSPIATQPRLPIGILLGCVGVVAALSWSYALPLSHMAQRWWHEPDYIHGFFVAPFAVWLLWHRRDMIRGVAWKGNAWGLALIALGAGVRLASVYFFYELLEPLSLLPCLAGLLLFVGGWRALRWAWPAIAFLVFLVPLPGIVAEQLSHPLQRLNTIMSLYVIQTVGIPCTARGNVIVLAHSQVGVAEVCNGLRMMPLFAAVAVGAVFVMRCSMVEKILDPALRRTHSGSRQRHAHRGHCRDERENQR